ncbi:MAG: hypothetical protein K9N62_10210 [Verrucomicrobia bacterium]|nr:hypothetical protein [Verrucomicrobiota bacterium]
MKETVPEEIQETSFVNEMRLTLRQWLMTLGLVALVLGFTPSLWKRVERFETDANYRIPYSLSKDYWLYDRWLDRAADSEGVFVLGDSVVWGEYVSPDGTLSSFLTRHSEPHRWFINAGVNGLFPLALEGLVDDYGGAIRRRRVILHCNLLWMSSPKVDLQTVKEEKFNHPRLVAQFDPRIPCYKADIAERLGIVVEKSLPFVSWVNHLQNAYFGQKNLLAWTMAEDGRDPPGFPNVYRNPLSNILLEVPAAAPVDPERGTASPRHQPWSTTGQGTARFDWVPIESSLQWAGFQRLARLLVERGNDLLVVIGPFNEHMMAEENAPRFRRFRDGAARWLTSLGIRFVQPQVLPSGLYADASHPLTGGYELLAHRLLDDPEFRSWMQNSGEPPKADSR